MSRKLQNVWQNYGFTIRGDPISVNELIEQIDEHPDIELKYIKCAGSNGEITITALHD